MTTPAIVEVLKAYLAKEGLVLCRPGDTQFALDGFKEVEALTGIVELIEDSQAVPDWVDPDAPTAPTKVDVLAAFAKSEAA